MACDSTRQSLLDFGWNPAERRRAAEIIEHLATCPACRAAAEDYDRLRAVLIVSDDVSADDDWLAPRTTPIPTAGNARFWRRALLAAAMVLLAIGIVAVVLKWGTRNANDSFVVQSHPPSAAPPAALQFTQSEIRQRVSAFDQVSQAFDKQTSWLLVSDQASDVGLSLAPLDPPKVLLLRLVVSQNKRVISSADLAIVPGKSAKLSLPLTGDQLTYEIKTSDDEPTRLSLWASLQKPGGGGETLAALATTLQIDPGQKISAGQFVTTSGAYDLNIAFARGITKDARP